MRVLLGLAGLVLAGAFAVLFLGGYVADLVAAAATAESPDDVSSNHSIAYLMTLFLSLVGGWFLGWGIGGAIRGSHDD